MMTISEILLIHQKKALSSIKNEKSLIDRDKLGHKWTHERVDRGKLGHKWTLERVDQASDEIINKKYVEYKQRELNERGEYTGSALGKHVINLHSTGISRWVKIRDIEKLDQDIENDPIIKDQMAGLGCLFVCTFGD